MEVHQLRYFVAVARARNFSRAAEACHVSQPSLSQQIMKLESELEEKLFERTKREVSLTPAGELFQRHAERILEEMDEARERVREVRGLVRGRVVLGVLPTVAPYFLPTRLKAFTTKYPGIEVQVHEDTTAQLARSVVAKEMDLALVSVPVEHAGLTELTLFEEALLVALPAGHRLARKRVLVPADLEQEPFILMKEGHCLAGQALQFCRLSGFAPRVSFRSAQIETVLAFVEAGWGVSIVPEMARRSVAREGVRFRRLAGMSRGIGVIHRRSGALSGAAKALVESWRPSLK